MKQSPFDPVAEARRVLSSEVAGIKTVSRRLGPSFGKAVGLLMSVKGKVIFSGVGKSGIIARKIAATFSSTGTPSVYLHPVDCLHGDLGVLGTNDAAIFISRSGNTDELLELVPSFRRFRVPVIGIMSTERSELGRMCDVVIETGTIREACPYNLAPTSSTTAALALGDALAIVLLKRRGFKKEDFALLHQSGSLGRRLQLRVSDLMHTGDEVPVVREYCSLRDTILEMTSKNLGITCVADNKGRLAGVFSDGDLRRFFHAGKKLDTPVRAVMTRTPKVVPPDMLAAQALALMEKYEITVLVCGLPDRTIAGVLHIHSILKAGVV